MAQFGSAYTMTKLFSKPVSTMVTCVNRDVNQLLTLLKDLSLNAEHGGL